MLDEIKQLTVREQPRVQAIQRQPTHCLTARRCYYSPAAAWPEYIAAFVLGPMFWYTRHGILFNFLPNLVIWHLGVAEPYVRRIDRRL